MQKAVHWLIGSCLIFSVILVANAAERPLSSILARLGRNRAIACCVACMLVPLLSLIFIGGPLGIFQHQGLPPFAIALCWLTGFGFLLGVGTLRRLNQTTPR